MRNQLPKEIREYMSEIGSKGGRKSKRTLTPEQARKMVEAREKKKSREQKSTDGKKKQ